LAAAAGREIRPEHGHHLLPVEAMLRSQREQFDHGLGLAQAPPLLRHRTRVHLQGKAAEK
jgi:hypothetical protein